MFLRQGYQTLDLVSNLKNKTSKTVSHLAINVPFHNRVSALADILICYGGTGQSIIFTSTKNEANQLLQSEKIKNQIEVMHGDIAQNQREVTLKRFKDKKFQVLVATDVASRGLDIPSVDLVIQVEPPKDPETYIHRSGRTARAGRSGTCITFFTNKHKLMLAHIEQKAGITMQKIGVPQPEQVIKASSLGIVEQLKEVNEKVIPLFGEAADHLITKMDGDVKKALC
jgi:ATP-dependent RNA helicase DDX21